MLFRVRARAQFAARALRFPENADLSKVRPHGSCAPALPHSPTLACTPTRQVTAHVEDGVLKIEIAKMAEPQRQRASVKVT